MKKILPLELEERVKHVFKMNCLKNKENMTTILKKFVFAYNKDSKQVMEFINKRVK